MPRASSRARTRRPAGPRFQAQFGAVFGIVAFGAKVYGFSRWGDFIAIDNDTGAGCLDWNATGINFAGAGITTTAAVVAPSPR